ncbi:uncharacterized protein LOC125316053 [Rhodamnia argentea]|uniref:Uncharacterized protein LOC125316053 n=1 Tax=Rhodamnia argentea TaxID=178133 RepID=A0ABM3HQW1_9MYRT|nr:uncharacterized protein LOC125316053 [Rhodamnia argentea]
MWAYPPTRKQLAVTIGVFAAGTALIAVGIHLSFANVAPQQARTKARSDFVKSRLRKYLDD